MNEAYSWIKLFVGVVATVGLYSVLYRETKFYRLVEHVFLGLAGGYMLVAIVKETLRDYWWVRMCGQVPEGSGSGVPSHWLYVFLLPLGLMGYTVFSKKYNWMSKIPVGIILGAWAGQQLMVWWTRWGPQIFSSIKPVWPTTFESFTKPSLAGLDPAKAAAIQGNIYPSQVISNIVFTVTIVSVLSYFFFSFEAKKKWLSNVNTLGRWLLMIGLGAMFGSTVMGRFALLIDRMYFVFVEFVQHKLLHL